MKAEELGDSRTRILEILRMGGCSVEGLQSRLDISPTAIRQHLAILEKDSLVAKVPLRSGAGRPRYVYSLTEKAEAHFPKAYEMLAQNLLGEISRRWGMEELLGILESMASSKGKELLAMVEGKTREERLESAVGLMNGLGYYIDWRKGEDGYSLRVHNCLFSKLVKHDSVLCTYDHAFFRTLLSSEIRRERSRTKGSEYCSFYLGKD